MTIQTSPIQPHHIKAHRPAIASKLASLPLPEELEARPELILEAPMRPAWALGLMLNLSPPWAAPLATATHAIDPLDMAEVSFTLPNTPEGERVRMSYWQFAYVATISTAGFSLTSKGSGKKPYVPYVRLQAFRATQHPRDAAPIRYNKLVARLLENAKRGEVVIYASRDRFDLRPSNLKRVGGTGREPATELLLRHLRLYLGATNSKERRRFFRLLKATQARLIAGTEAYRQAILKAEEEKASLPK